MTPTRTASFKTRAEVREKVPPSIWARGHAVVRVPILDARRLAAIELGRGNPFGDANQADNHFPAEMSERRFDLKPQEERENPMQEMLYPEGVKK